MLFFAFLLTCNTVPLREPKGNGKKSAKIRVSYIRLIRVPKTLRGEAMKAILVFEPARLAMHSI